MGVVTLDLDYKLYLVRRDQNEAANISTYVVPSIRERLKSNRTISDDGSEVPT